MRSIWGQDHPKAKRFYEFFPYTPREFQQDDEHGEYPIDGDDQGQYEGQEHLMHQQYEQSGEEEEHLEGEEEGHTGGFESGQHEEGDIDHHINKGQSFEEQGDKPEQESLGGYEPQNAQDEGLEKNEADEKLEGFQDGESEGNGGGPLEDQPLEENHNEDADGDV